MTQRPEWLKDGWPELRDAPPWVMQEMIESEPELLERIAQSGTRPTSRCCSAAPGR